MSGADELNRELRRARQRGTAVSQPEPDRAEPGAAAATGSADQGARGLTQPKRFSLQELVRRHRLGDPNHEDKW